MVKIIALVAAVAGGVTYGMYEFTDVFHKCDGGSCPLSAGNSVSCCAGTEELASCCSLQEVSAKPGCCSEACDLSAKAAVGSGMMFISAEMPAAAKPACCAAGCCLDTDDAMAAVAGSAIVFSGQ